MEHAETITYLHLQHFSRPWPDFANHLPIELFTDLVNIQTPSHTARIHAERSIDSIYVYSTQTAIYSILPRVHHCLNMCVLCDISPVSGTRGCSLVTNTEGERYSRLAGSRSCLPFVRMQRDIFIFLPFVDYRAHISHHSLLIVPHVMVEPADDSASGPHRVNVAADSVDLRGRCTQLATRTMLVCTVWGTVGHLNVMGGLSRVR